MHVVLDGVGRARVYLGIAGVSVAGLVAQPPVIAVAEGDLSACGPGGIVGNSASGGVLAGLVETAEGDLTVLKDVLRVCGRHGEESEDKGGQREALRKESHLEQERPLSP